MDLPGRVHSSPSTAPARTGPATEPAGFPLATARPTTGVTAPLIAYRLGGSALPLAPAAAGRDWMAATDQHFASRCLPLLMANQSGWVLLNNAGLTARWSGDDALRGVEVSYDDGQWPLAGSFFGYGILTWSIPYLFRTPVGWDLLVRGPANSPKHGIAPLEGLVETDWSSSTFTMNWKFTAPGVPVRFEIGEPICMIVPQPRAALEEFRPVMMPVEADPELHRRHLAWARSRHDFLIQRADGWQKDYVRGRHATGESAETPHRTRVHLAGFDPADESPSPAAPHQ
ncbi:hypothetical protein GCM10011512_28170 [Tersicoccus solisilvae]|uniref:Uncharacterized protein n=1 Tax=Tersicoccus solisilvae TaxID=1882339 RepID=A0ABQ1PMD2_9MICC|nr:DUF6065 family protein [Tersicoccus solisilvae]GGC99614.1 hypothetical protein GCM10011512_28170 [Tersicoccus solisilvae]